VQAIAQIFEKKVVNLDIKNKELLLILYGF
jgi:hypothetical protein